MKKQHKFFGILAAASILVCGGASAFNFMDYRALPSVKLPIPQTPDSTQKENQFKIEQFLKSRNIIPGASAAGWTTMVPDSSGTLRLATVKDIPELRTFGTNLRANRFAKGKLALYSTSRAEVTVNGESKITKITADSTMQQSDATMELNPEADYEIIVNILAASDDKTAPEFKLEFIPDDKFNDVEFATTPSQQKRVSPLTTMIGERVNSANLSADGKYMILLTRETVSAKETNWRASLRETATGKTLSESIDIYARWLPNSNAFVTHVKREGKYDFYRTDVPSMKTTLIAKSVPDENVTFSPDERYLIYTKKTEAEKQTGKMHRIDVPDDRIPGNRDRSYIMKYDLESHITLPVTQGGPSTYLCDISADGKKILYLSSVNIPDKYPFYYHSIIETDVNTLKNDTLVSNCEASISEAIYSPDAKKLFIIAGPAAFDGIGANYAPHEIGNDFDNQGFIFDIATKEAKAMTRDFDPSLTSAVQWNQSDNKIYFVAESGFNRFIYLLDPKTDKITKLPTELEFTRSFSMGDRESNYMSYWGGGFTSDGEAWLLNLKTGKSTLIANPLKEVTKDVQFGKMEQWKFTASNGSEIDGYMCLPPDFDPEKKYPLIVYYYGGTSPSTATFYHLYSPQVFASRDYVVYVLNPSGTTGYGQEFSARHVNAWGKQTAEEIIEGTKKFCEAHPFVDSKKIGCLGASYGGFMTQYLQTLTDIFAAAVSHAGISNVTSYWGEGYWGHSYNSVAAAKSYPWNNPDLYTKQGALFNADKIHTPLLLLHGTVDTNVPIGESIQMFNALKILGREVEFITVQDENHVISDFDNKQVWQNTIMAWFAKWLQDDPRWWDNLYGK